MDDEWCPRVEVWEKAQQVFPHSGVFLFCSLSNNKKMLPVALDCEANQSEGGGASRIAVAFLLVFVLLLAFDAFATAFAIWKTLQRKPPDDCVQPKPKPGGKAAALRRANSSINAHRGCELMDAVPTGAVFDRGALGPTQVFGAR